MIKIVKEMQNGPRSLAQSSPVVMVREVRSLHKIKHRDESCVETDSQDRNSSTRKQSSLFDQDTSGHKATVLSNMNASDFPKSDFESEQSRAGAVESRMHASGRQMSAESPVAEFWECIERDMRRKYEMYLRTHPMVRGRVQASALLEPKFQLIVRFRIVLDAVPRAMHQMALNDCLLGVCQVILKLALGHVLTENRLCCGSSVLLN